MESTRGRAYGQYLIDIEQYNGTVFRRDDIMKERTAVGCGICFTEHLSDIDNIDDTAIAPVIMFLYMDTAVRHDSDTAEMLTLPKDMFTFFIRNTFCLQTSEHRKDVVFSHTCE